VDIGIKQLDGTIPNLALMQIGAYHKLRKDSVTMWEGPLFSYDKVYASKIFKFTEDALPSYVIRGGTGYNNDPLPSEIAAIEHSKGWFLYPDYHNHLGFAERGCRLKCSFCVVPEKEGLPKEVATIESLLSNPLGEDRLVLLDDDFLGHPRWEDVFIELADRKLKVCFSQGLNIRTITEKQAHLLGKISLWNHKFTYRQIAFAWDNPKDEKTILRGFNRCVEAGIKPYKMQFYVLIGYDSTPEEDLHRVETLRKLGANPFAMAYDRTVQYQKDFQRWVNHKAIFKTVKFKDYRGKGRC